jgi:hypothetical protein
MNDVAFIWSHIHFEECSPSVTKNSEFIFLTFMEHVLSYLKCRPFGTCHKGQSHYFFDELLVPMNSFQHIS